MKLDLEILNHEIDRTLRVEMLGSMFDMPIEQKMAIRLKGDVPIEDRKWNIGLIVGPSGSGKTLTLEKLFGKPEAFEWKARSVIDDFPSGISMESISSVCQSVGFNTIPAWIRPFDVLSNGERFRAQIARLLLLGRDTIIIDEFSSVVDRQVAQITSHSVQKFVRQHDKRLVAASCHYDIIDWLQPDWILEPGDPLRFQWRELQSRPPLRVEIRRVPYEVWELFKNYHYMTPELNKAARCYGLFVNSNSSRMGSKIRHNGIRESEYRSDSNNGTGEEVWIHDESRIACFLGVLHRPHPRVKDIVGVSRIVTLPDFQGLGLAYVLSDTVASAYRALGKRFHNYPNHPAYIRSHQRSRNYIQIKESGNFSPHRGNTSTVAGFGGKRCAVFMYVGPSMNLEEAKNLVNGE